MRDEDKEKLLIHIHQRLKVLEKDILVYTELSKPVPPDNSIGRLTRMEAIGNKSINEAALREAKYAQARLENAIITIDKPQFGLCRECDEPIPIGRLMVMPESDLCVACAETNS